MKTKVWMNSYLTMTPIHKSSSNDPPTTSKSCHHLLIFFLQKLWSLLIHNLICWYLDRKKSPFRSYFLFSRQHELLHGLPWWIRLTMLSLPKKVKTKRIQHYQQITKPMAKNMKTPGIPLVLLNDAASKLSDHPDQDVFLLSNLRTGTMKKKVRRWWGWSWIVNLRNTVVLVYQLNRTCCADMLGLCTNPAREKIIAWL